MDGPHLNEFREGESKDIETIEEDRLEFQITYSDLFFQFFSRREDIWQKLNIHWISRSSTLDTLAK